MKINNWTRTEFLILIFLLQFLVYIITILDIAFVRQIVGFIFLSFVPGFLFLKIFKLVRNSLVENILFSVGSSLVLIMLIGILLNVLGSINLLISPLSSENLIIFIQIFVALMNILVFLRNEKSPEVNINNLTKKLPSLVYLVIPFISVLGIIFLRNSGNNFLLLLTIILIAGFFILGLFFANSSHNYILILFASALALLLSITLISNYVYGPDIQLEFNIFRETQELSYHNWQSGYTLDHLAMNGMASISILPVMLSNFLNIEGGLVFKVLFSLFFSLVPIGLYQLHYPHWGKKAAFIAVFLFIASFEFYSLLPTMGRQMIGELFFILLFLIIFKRDIYEGLGKWVLISVFVFGLVISHYSVNYIYLFLILTTFFFGRIFIRNKKIKIDSLLITFSFCLTFFWYLFLTLGPFEKLNRVATVAVNNLIAEFTIGANDLQVQRALGLVASPTPLHTLGKVLFYVITGLIALGFISLLLKLKNRKFDTEYGLLLSINMILLVFSVILPQFVTFLNMERMYHITLLFLAPLFVLAIGNLFRHKTKLTNQLNSSEKKKQKIKLAGLLLTSILLVTFFLFQSGFIYEIAEDPIPSSISLSFNKMENSTYLVHESDVFGATWLSDYGEIEDKWTWADTVSIDYVLRSYSSIHRNMMLLLSNTSEARLPHGTFQSDLEIDTKLSYVYLSQYNVQVGKIAYNPRNNVYYDIEENPILNNEEATLNKIYSNSNSEIYYRIE